MVWPEPRFIEAIELAIGTPLCWFRQELLRGWCLGGRCLINCLILFNILCFNNSNALTWGWNCKPIYTSMKYYLEWLCVAEVLRFKTSSVLDCFCYFHMLIALYCFGIWQTVNFSCYTLAIGRKAKNVKSVTLHDVVIFQIFSWGTNATTAASYVPKDTMPVYCVTSKIDT